MRGEVEVFKVYESGRRESIYKDHNLIVDSMSHTLCDFLTISSGLNAIPSASSILDASNFRVLGMSFSKAGRGYEDNAHEMYLNYHVPHNFISGTELFTSSYWTYGASSDPDEFENDIVVSSNAILGPIPGTSATLLLSKVSGAYLRNEVIVSDEHKLFTSSNELAFSFYIKPYQNQHTHFKIELDTDLGTPEPSREVLIHFGHDIHTEIEHDFDQVQVFEKEEDRTSGWHRIVCNFKSNGSTPTFATILVTPWAQPVDPNDVSDPEFKYNGLYLYGLQLEKGWVASEYKKVELNDNDNELAGQSMDSILTRLKYLDERSIRVVQKKDELGQTFFGSVDVSSYWGFPYKPREPVPMDTKLELDARPQIVKYTDLSSCFYDHGHNLNFFASPSGGKFNDDHGNAVWTGSSVAAFFGCWAPSEAPIKYYILSSWDTPDTWQSSGLASSFANNYGIIDINGYIREFSTANSYSGVGSSITTATVSSTGIVTYTFRIHRHDMIALALYGGIYNIGLWGLDIRETLKQGSPPFSFSVVNNPRRYRLFAVKSFLRDLLYIEGNLGAAFGGFAARASSDTEWDLLINWTLVI